MELPQICLHHCESHLCWNWYLSLFQRIFLFGRITGPGSYNIFIYCTAVIVIRESFTLGGCLGVGMSNVIGGGVVTPLSLELAQWYC